MLVLSKTGETILKFKSGYTCKICTFFFKVLLCVLLFVEVAHPFRRIAYIYDPFHFTCHLQASAFRLRWLTYSVCCTVVCPNNAPCHCMGFLTCPQISVNAQDCTRGLYIYERSWRDQSSLHLKFNHGRKIPCLTGELNWHQQVTRPDAQQTELQPPPPHTHTHTHTHLSLFLFHSSSHPPPPSPPFFFPIKFLIRLTNTLTNAFTLGWLATDVSL